MFGQRKNGDAIVGALVFLVVCGAAWLACHWFAGRAAFLLVGAMMATAMSANVFFWIIPGQRTTVVALREGRPGGPIHGKRAKQRSVHNTYFTLPVLFAMLSNHYSFTYTHPQNWLVLILMMLAGACHPPVFRDAPWLQAGRNGHPWPYALVGPGQALAVVGEKPPLSAGVSHPAWPALGRCAPRRRGPPDLRAAKRGRQGRVHRARVQRRQHALRVGAGHFDGAVLTSMFSAALDAR
jgi:hypothetical protein